MNGAPTKLAGKFPDYGRFQLMALVSMRILIGWHFLYEGIAKLSNPYWTSAGYLQESKGWLSEPFTDLANNESLLVLVDNLNQWGLMLIGLALLLGFFTGLEYAMPAEGSYLIVNKILIELAALLVVVVFPTAHRVGLDRLLFRKRAVETA
jgi:thiosulfate dehydrogenase [quinone] large subunit